MVSEPVLARVADEPPGDSWVEMNKHIAWKLWDRVKYQVFIEVRIQTRRVSDQIGGNLAGQ